MILFFMNINASTYETPNTTAHEDTQKLTVNSSCVHTANLTYMQLIKAAASQTLNIESYEGFIKFIDTFENPNSVNTPLDSHEYESLKTLKDQVLAKFKPGLFEKKSNAKDVHGKDFTPTNKQVVLDLDYGLSLIFNNAYKAKQLSYSCY